MQAEWIRSEAALGDAARHRGLRDNGAACGLRMPRAAKRVPARVQRGARAALALLGTLACGSALASGLSLNESSAAEIGNAHAGAAAAEDASALVWNPAALALLPGVQFSGTLAAIDYAPSFTNEGSTSPIGTPATGGNGGRPGGVSLLPSVFLSAPLTPALNLGLGVYEPFGLSTNYDAGWVGRYQAVKSEFRTVNINPALAWKASDVLSVGVGLDVMYAHADLSRAIDFGAACFAQAGPALCSGAGILPQGSDGTVEVAGSGWGVGANAGLMLQLTPATRVGLAYRSKIREDLGGGQASFSNPVLPGPFAALTATPATTTGAASTTVWLPESASLHIFSALSERWSAMANVGWVRWSALDQLQINFANGAPPSTTTFDWRDTWTAAMALNYQLQPAIKLRAGFEYEQGAARSGYENPLIPESNRRFLGLGVNIRLSPQASVDVGYAHVFFGDFGLSNSVPGQGTLSGSYAIRADILAVQYNHRF
jgi:long-chain fatty acid transport protein